MFESSETADLRSAIVELYPNTENYREKNKVAVENIIKALEAGADPTKIAEDENTVLTVAIVYDRPDLVDLVFEKFPKKHPIFNLNDSLGVAGNTPLGLALKKGKYDLAEKLIKEKECDVNGLIRGNGTDDHTNIYPLHLCAFLLGTFYGENNEKDQQLVDLMKEIIKRGGRLDQKIFYGHMPCDILELAFKKEDFDLYMDNRTFFEYYLHDPFTLEEVMTGNEVSSLLATLEYAPEEIASNRKKGKSEKADREEQRYHEAQIKFARICDERPDLVEQAKRLSDSKSQDPKIVKYIENTGYEYSYSREEIEKQYGKGNVPDYFKIARVSAELSNSFLAVMMGHCGWHREKFGREIITNTRNQYFESPEGSKARGELVKLMKPSLSPRDSK